MSPDQQELNVEVEGDLLPYAAEQRATRSATFSATGRTLQRQDVLAFKFGGTSLLGSERILHAARIAQDASASASVVASASVPPPLLLPPPPQPTTNTAIKTAADSKASFLRSGRI